MVSFTLNTSKFLLIYRHLQNIYWFKRGARLMLASRSEGLRIAQYVETSNAESPTQMYVYAQPPCPRLGHGLSGYNTPMGRFPLLGF